MRTVLLHEFLMGDVEDPEIYAAQPIYEWQQSEAGQWCMKTCAPAPEFYIHPSADMYGYRVTIFGQMSDEDFSYFLLKWR